jgi:aminoglycoside 6'-N-acetyltransferase
MIVNFEPLHEEHFPLLLKWLEAPHVKKWWDTDVLWTPELVEKKYGTYTQRYKLENGVKKGIDAFIIFLDDIYVGYIQLYDTVDFPREEDSTATNTLRKSLAGIDIFIGEEDYLGKGLSFLILNQFLKIFVDPHYEACFVDPDSANIAAIHAYEKVGFQYLKTTKHSQWLVRNKHGRTGIL